MDCLQSTEYIGMHCSDAVLLNVLLLQVHSQRTSPAAESSSRPQAVIRAEHQCCLGCTQKPAEHSLVQLLCANDEVHT